VSPGHSACVVFDRSQSMVLFSLMLVGRPEMMVDPEGRTMACGTLIDGRVYAAALFSVTTRLATCSMLSKNWAN
jgi:hypothetical protein